ncbi:MAG TPA: hypothetical protein PKL97_07425 [Candidatus Omnitrophota bacterium]|nr:hypothetical protein [Candidatus Omnitrophota bacterium]
MNINPTMQFSILCDDVRREDNGKFMFLGLFETIGGASFPLKHSRFYVANRWCKGAGAFKEKIRVIREETGESLLVSGETTFELKELHHYHTTINRFDGIVFPAPGKYLVEVLLNDDLVISYPVALKQIKSS